MKKLVPAILAAAAIMATPAFAENADDIHLTEDEWWQKEGFFLSQVNYMQYKVKDLGKPMQGGGFGVGGEYVNPDMHIGYGGMFSFNWTMQDYTHYKADDRLIALDFFIPARISNSLTVYGGVGGTMHGFDLEWDDGYGWNMSGEQWKNDGVAVTWSAHVGFRWRFFGHTYLFGEYRREFGKIDMVCKNYHYLNGRNIKDEMDMSGNHFLAGLGLAF